jgi:hypothetical protein
MDIGGDNGATIRLKTAIAVEQTFLRVPRAQAGKPTPETCASSPGAHRISCCSSRNALAVEAGQMAWWGLAWAS